MARQQVLNAISAQRSTPSAGKQGFGICSALLPNPRSEDRDCGFGQGCTAFLSSFPPATHMGAGCEPNILVPQRGHLGQSQAGLNGGDKEGIVTASQPRCSI